MKKIYKIVEQPNGTIKFYGSNRWIKVYCKKPEWSKYEEPAFRYRGREYFLSEFVCTPATELFGEFDGYMPDSFFSGICIKVSKYGDEVKAYTYIS